MSSTPLLQKAASGGKGDEAWKDNVIVTRLDGRSRRRKLYEDAFWLLTPLLLGLVLGFALPAPHSLPAPYDRISSVIGWTYFMAWSISFYPQAFLNWRRRSVVGLSLDFQLLNLLGFGCYAAYNAALYWSPVVREQYACMTGGQTPAVHANDVGFALHAAVVTAFTLFQCAIYDRGGQKVSWPAALGVGGALASIAAYLAAVIGAEAQQGGGGGHTDPPHSAIAGAAGGGALGGGDAPVPCGTTLSWLSFLYFLSYIKLGVSLVKYMPQVYLNYSRKSTDGWNIHNILLDFGGGLLSLAQLLMDSIINNRWEAITGNPVKFGLGFTSMFFDVIFMAQHWWLYPAGGLQAAKDWTARGGTPSAPTSPRDASLAGLSTAGSSGRGGGEGGEEGEGEIEADVETGAGGSSRSSPRAGSTGGSSSSTVVVAAEHFPLLR